MLDFFNTIRVSNSLDPDQARHFVGPDLGPNCLQRLSADNIKYYFLADTLAEDDFIWLQLFPFGYSVGYNKYCARVSPGKPSDQDCALFSIQNQIYDHLPRFLIFF